MTLLLNRYANLIDLANQRRENVQESCQAFQLVREAAELVAWITEKENTMIGGDVGEDLEQVEEMQKNFDDFQKVCYCLFSCKYLTVLVIFICTICC